MSTLFDTPHPFKEVRVDPTRHELRVAEYFLEERNRGVYALDDDLVEGVVRPVQRFVASFSPYDVYGSDCELVGPA